MPLQESEMSIGKLIGMAPDVIKKVKEFREKREKDKSADDDGNSEETEES